VLQRVDQKAEGTLAIDIDVGDQAAMMRDAIGLFGGQRRMAGRDHQQSDKSANPPTSIRRSAIVETAYRLLMIASGVVTFPVRALQASLGRGDEIVLTATLPARW